MSAAHPACTQLSVRTLLQIKQTDTGDNLSEVMTVSMISV